MHYTTELLSILSVLITYVIAIPTWEGISARSSMSFVPGASPVQALDHHGQLQTRAQKYLSVTSGSGNVIISSTTSPRFFINHDQLWQYTNDTYILPVNVLNSTLTASAPLKLAVGKMKDDDVLITGGTWRWLGTMLHYDHGSRSNQGLFYHCRAFRGGYVGLHMFLEPSPTPPGCTIMTLHAWSRMPSEDP